MAEILERIADGRTDLVFEYIASGNPATGCDAGGTPLIRHCAYYGDVSAIRFLLSQGERLESLGENYDLNGACFHGHWRLCQFLLEQGANPNHPLPDTGEVPLHAALCKPNRPAYEYIVRILLAHGADPNLPTKPGVETGGFMRDIRTRGEAPLHRAAAFGTEAAINSLLDAGADPEARDANGDSPLTWASWHLRPAHILKLLCFGPHRIHPLAVEHSRAHAGMGWASMEHYLLGTPHVETVPHEKLDQ